MGRSATFRSVPGASKPCWPGSASTQQVLGALSASAVTKTARTAYQHPPFFLGNLHSRPRPVQPVASCLPQAALLLPSFLRRWQHERACEKAVIIRGLRSVSGVTAWCAITDAPFLSNSTEPCMIVLLLACSTTTMVQTTRSQPGPRLQQGCIPNSVLESQLSRVLTTPQL